LNRNGLGRVEKAVSDRSALPPRRLTDVTRAGPVAFLVQMIIDPNEMSDPARTLGTS
jgi:hypothetical protein